MKTLIKPAFMFIFAISIMMLIANSGFIGNSFSHIRDTHPKEHTDCSNLSDHSHSHSCDDVFAVNSLKFKTFTPCTGRDINPRANFHIKERDISCVWQPPKYAPIAIS